MTKLFFKETLSDQFILIYKCFINFCLLELDIKTSPNVYLLDSNNEYDITTGGYDRGDNVYCRSERRALIDCLRTIAHELVHLKQKEEGKFDMNEPVQDIGGPIEDEANAVAGQLIKKFSQGFDCKWIYRL